MPSRAARRPLALWLLIVGALMASSAFVGWRVLGPSDGALIPFYADAWSAAGVRIDLLPDGAAGLRPGDLVVAVDGRPISEWLDQALAGAGASGAAQLPGSAPYVVQRAGEDLAVTVHFAQRDLLPYLLDNWGNLLFAVAVLALGLFALWRRPELPAARALAIASIAAGGSTLPWMLGLHASDLFFGWPFAFYVVTVSALYMLLWPAGAIHLPLALMGGPGSKGPTSGRRLAAVYGLPLAGYVALLIGARVMSPTTSAWIGTWPTVQGLVIIPTATVGLALAALAYRRAGSDARRRLRWALAGGGMATVVGLAVMFVPQLVLGRPLLSWSMVGLIALPLPVGLAIAILRHRLFDIEIVVNRTLVYGGVTLAILGTYVAGVTLIGSLIGAGGSFAVSLLATGVAALVALPVRDVLQRAVNRLMYGDRDDPYRALGRLGERLEGTLDPLEGPSVVVRTVADSMRVPWVGLRIGSPDEAGRSFEHGQRPAWNVLEVPLMFGAEEVGRLLVAQRSAAEALTWADRRLLDALALQAGPAVRALGLTFDLADSRQRIISAREEERRRIRRDLHDGLGPTLAAIGMRAEVAADLAGKDDAAARETLLQLHSEASAALADIRRLVDELRPPALDEHGLVGAIRLQTDKLAGSMSINVQAADLPQLPAAVEVAAYRICVEAATNAVRHSAATRCDLEIGVDAAPGGTALHLVIADDGRGMAPSTPSGIGLRSMRARAEEVGGAFKVSSNGRRGTRVEAILPLAQAGTAGAA